MSLKEVTNGLPQAFSPLNTKHALTLSIFRATFQVNSPKRARDEAERRIIFIITKH